MRFFRRFSSPALLTLLAVAMQAMLLLAHAHTHTHSSATTLALAGGKSAPIACRALIPPKACAPAAPSDNHDDCPLCSTLAASAAGLLPAPLPLAIAAAPVSSLLPLPDMPARDDASSWQFQARAPPIA